MIRPWYGSWLFWFGLPGLAMLLWLWLENPLRHFEVRAMWRDRCWYAADSSRLLEIGWNARPSVYSPLNFDVHQELRAVDRLFPPALWLSSYGDASDWDRKWFIAYWLLILGYLPLWLGSVAWWQRRKHRLSAAGMTGRLPVEAQAPEQPPVR